MADTPNNKPDLKQMMELAEQVQKNIQDMQKSMANRVVTAVAGTGEITVEVEMNCESQVLKVTISEIAAKEGPDVLGDLIAAAVNKAIKKVKETIQNALSDIYQRSGISTGSTGKAEE
jgi:DNA-binding YbaB/EbfC family protein